jgi:hypothetical protein
LWATAEDGCSRKNCWNKRSTIGSWSGDWWV